MSTVYPELNDSFEKVCKMHSTIDAMLKEAYNTGYSIGTKEGYGEGYEEGYEKGLDENAFSEEDCIDLLQKTGWMVNHDKEIFEHGQNSINYAYESGLSENEKYQRGMEDLASALKDRAFLKANYNTKNWLDILRDFDPGQIVKEWKDYCEKIEENDGGIKVGDVVIVKDAANRPFEGVITKVDASDNTKYPYCVLFADGTTEWETSVSITGRRIDVSSVLGELRDTEIGECK